MPASDIVAGLVGGLGGAVEGYGWLQEMKRKQQEEEARMAEAHARRQMEETKLRIQQEQGERAERQAVRSQVGEELQQRIPDTPVSPEDAARIREAGYGYRLGEETRPSTPGLQPIPVPLKPGAAPMGETTETTVKPTVEQFLAQEKERRAQAALENLPEHLRPAAAYGTATGKLPTFGAADFETPEQAEAREAAAGQRDIEGAIAKEKALQPLELEEAERKAQIEARYRPPPREPKERLVQVMGPNGTPQWVRESEAEGKPAAQAARAVTGAERTALGFYNRAQEAIDTLTTPGEDGKSLEQRIAGASLPGQARLQYAPNVLQSEDNQFYRQAQRSFTEARLRKESGAAIPPHEYENDARTYFAQPGDSPKTIEQKRKSRQVVLEGLKYASGRAYAEYYGDEAGAPQSAPPSSRPERRQIPGGGVAELRNGKWIRVQ